MQVQSLGGEDLWRRVWQPTPVFLPGESHGQRRLMGYSPWGHKESDMTEHAHTHKHKISHVSKSWEWRQHLLVSSLSEIIKKHSKDQDSRSFPKSQLPSV